MKKVEECLAYARARHDAESSEKGDMAVADPAGPAVDLPTTQPSLTGESDPADPLSTSQCKFDIKVP